MKFKIEQRVFNRIIGKNCLVIGTKEIPYKPKIHPTNKKEIYPENGYDYILFIEKSNDGNNINYLGTISANENDLSIIK